MKKNQYVWSLILLLFICFNSCKKNETVPDPMIAGVSPASGVVGTSIIITGSNFSTTPSANFVKFNGVDATVSDATKDGIIAIVPVGATTGKITVIANGKTATSPSDFTVLVTSISSISPTSGIQGASVVISGNNFDTAPANNVVKFNGTAANVINATSTSLTVSVPSGATTGKISVSINGVTETFLTDFTVLYPSITSFSPTSGVPGSALVITGTNFNPTDNNNIVKFNGTNAIVTGVTPSGPVTQLIVIVPQATAGPISVTNGTFTATSATNFTFLAPTITSLSPSIGSAGTSVVITGTNFSKTKEYNIVKFNGTVATVTNATSTQITATVPTGATTGNISVEVGPFAVASPGNFTVCNGIELLLSNVAITSTPTTGSTSFNYTFDLTNVGGTQAVLTSGTTTLQAYVSTDNIYNNGNELAASGWGIDATINGGGSVYHGGFSSNISGGTVGDHPYLILVFSTTAAITECDNSISHIVIKKIIP